MAKVHRSTNQRQLYPLATNNLEKTLAQADSYQPLTPVSPHPIYPFSLSRPGTQKGLARVLARPFGKRGVKDEPI
jgi:hypothetical protein